LNTLAGNSLLPPKEELKDYVRNNVSTLWHPVGTCRLGSDPTTSVVDSSLQVHGVTDLHICDSSATPYVTAGNNHVPSLVMAELLFDLLLDQT
jgi:choline dehydrogenase